MVVRMAYLNEYVYFGRGNITYRISGPTVQQGQSLTYVYNPRSPGLSFTQVLQSREEKQLGQIRE